MCLFFLILSYYLPNTILKITVEVSQQDIVAVIAGGSYAQFGKDSSFVLDGTGSYDPDLESGVFSYLWICDAVSSGADCSGLVDATNSSTLNIAANDLSIGEYSFTLYLEKGVRNDTSTITVEIIAGAPPVIEFDALTTAKFNAVNLLKLVSLHFHLFHLLSPLPHSFSSHNLYIAYHMSYFVVLFHI